MMYNKPFVPFFEDFVITFAYSLLKEHKMFSVAVKSQILRVPSPTDII